MSMSNGDLNENAAPASLPLSRNTVGRVVGGSLLILFALVGGIQNLNQTPSAMGINAVLQQASRPLDNALTIVMMIVIIVGGLVLIIRPPRSRPKG